MRRYAWPMRGRDILDMARVLLMWYFTVTRRLTPTSEASMEIQRIIDDSSLSTEAKVILLTAEIVNPKTPTHMMGVRNLATTYWTYTYRTR